MLLCTRSPPVINRTFLPQPSHTPFFFWPQHDGLLFSLSLSHLPSNAGTLSLPLIYHFLLPLSSLSIAISLPVRLCCQIFFQDLWPSFLFSSLPLPRSPCLRNSPSRTNPPPLPPSTSRSTGAPFHHTRARHTHATCSFIFHLCQSPWSCLRESNPPSNLSLYSYSLFDSRSFLFSIFLLTTLCLAK